MPGGYGGRPSHARFDVGEQTAHIEAICLHLARVNTNR
ncbi:hypothetical protein KKY_2961 [Pelagibacterium halotolerans B2]|uniref:Uncharacterized protein n=1 Tax=Pelagibacterium halotolerans (strain DSM 22347 / JCM 15775 / CGMCC 1.7692 / B2) TaxID=1082931 RepID=G4RF23_PELHB|nr:hypothetical protein KKY_2961 [Pelagibacterium halotolerans B2]